jgi:hypothetical protein
MIQRTGFVILVYDTHNGNETRYTNVPGENALDACRKVAEKLNLTWIGTSVYDPTDVHYARRGGDFTDQEIIDGETDEANGLYEITEDTDWLDWNELEPNPSC